ncbi:ATP-binding protein [Achromobacter spanius]|uniref:ATP-binding protein n=1 Tax=Achromobacter spanius TaxID=217203 RepID=UPI00320958F8
MACIVAGAVFFLYWSFSDTVSSYRRQMNAAAYNAQLFFDQREILLRSLASSSVRNVDAAPASETPPYFGNTQQIQVFPLQEEANVYGWALILTPRDLNDISLARTQLLFTSLRSGRTAFVGHHSPEFDHPIDSATQSWIAHALAAADPNLLPGGHSPIVWLKPPMDPANQLYLYTPVDPASPGAGWIGLKLGDIDAAIDLTSLRGGSYALFDQNDAPVLHSPGVATILQSLGQREGKEDAFGWWGNGLLPSFVVLNKSMGDAGWRLLYFTPINRILGDTAYAIQAAFAGAALLFAAVILGIRHIKKKLVAPALKQYEALADSVDLNRRLVEVAPVGLCLLRRNDGTPLLSNELAREWLLGDTDLLTRLLAPNDCSAGREYVLQDGRCVYLTFAPISYHGVEAVLCGINDITAFKRVERTITQAKLHADAANHAKTVFLATMSHEIRTPLFGILGTLEMLSLTVMDNQQQQYLETMQQSSATLLRTINDTLDLSRIEAGHLELEVAEFSPAEVLESAVSSYAARAEAKGLHLYALSDVSSPAAVVGDVTRVRQILNNLVSNAIKFTSSGHIVLRLQVMQRDARAATLKFQVADTGMGISPEFHAQLFEPYFRAENGPSQTVPGTGLGLAICRRLSEMMGGKLSAVSEPGLGTSMSLELTLPLAIEAHPEMAIRLDPKPVFVRGAVNDVVNNLCQWLRHRGAVAMPYRSALHSRLQDGVLVEAWPRDAHPAAWNGARVIAQPHGVHPRLEGGRNSWMANAHSLASIIAAVRLAQDGVAAKVTLEVKTSRDALDMHVLVAEDNPISRQILREQLEHLGCTVVMAANGMAALMRPDIPAFDAILTDLQMPEMDGYGFARALRAQGYTRPIVGITASAFTDDLRRCTEAGMTSVLLKPLPLSALREALIALKEVI